MPINFSSLSGEDFEFFCRDLLESLRIEIMEGPSRGPDGKKDLIISYSVKDVIGRKKNYTLLVQCKNKAISEKSVYESELGDIRSSCKIHNTDGYFLITTTILSTTVQNNLKAIDEEGIYITHYWDKYILEKYISKSMDGIKILERYGLIQSEYKIYAFNALVPEEYDLMSKMNEKLSYNIEPINDYDIQLTTSNSCYVSNGHIINLYIKKSNLGELIEQLDTFNHLEILELHKMQINSFPISITKLKKLELLMLPNNNIRQIPKGILDLKKLRSLNISYNPLEKIEITVEFLKKLDDFFIDKHQIKVFKNAFDNFEDIVNSIPNFDIIG